MDQQRLTFVVVLTDSVGNVRVAGPYKKFDKAEGDAKAWDKTIKSGVKVTTYVLPLESPTAILQE